MIPESSAALEALQRELADTSRLAFDLDGTLYDTRDFERPALAGVARWLRERSGQTLPGAEQALWRRRESDRHRPGLFDDLLRDAGLPVEWGAECARRFHDHPGEELRSAHSLKPLLLHLREQHRELALVSNGRAALQRRKLALLGLSDLFAPQVFCDPREPARLKPSTWAWTQLQEWRGGVAAVYVGDDPVDAAFAAAGAARYVKFCFRSSRHDH